MMRVRLLLLLFCVIDMLISLYTTHVTTTEPKQRVKPVINIIEAEMSARERTRSPKTIYGSTSKRDISDWKLLTIT